MFLVPMTRSASDLVRHFDRLFDDSFERVLTGTPAQSVLSSARHWTLPNQNKHTQ